MAGEIFRSLEIKPTAEVTKLEACVGACVFAAVGAESIVANVEVLYFLERCLFFLFEVLLLEVVFSCFLSCFFFFLRLGESVMLSASESSVSLVALGDGFFFFFFFFWDFDLFGDGALESLEAPPREFF